MRLAVKSFEDGFVTAEGDLKEEIVAMKSSLGSNIRVYREYLMKRTRTYSYSAHKMISKHS